MSQNTNSITTADTGTVIEHTCVSEDALRAHRRRQINRGVAVSLMAFDPSRGVYTYDESEAA